MRKSRFKEEQIIRILRESEVGNQTVSQTARKHGVVDRYYSVRSGSTSE